MICHVRGLYQAVAMCRGFFFHTAFATWDSFIDNHCGIPSCILMFVVSRAMWVVFLCATSTTSTAYHTKAEHSNKNKKMTTYAYIVKLPWTPYPIGQP
jgi:hypothetical protein